MAPSRLEKAKTFGAHHGIDLSHAEDGPGRVELLREATDGGADVLVDLTGVPSAFSEGVRAVRPGGRFVSVGNISPNKFTDFDPGLFTRSGVSMYAVIRYPTYFLSRSIRFLEETPHYPWEDLVDADFAFTDVRAGIQAAEDKTVTRAGIVIGEND
jgi:threonine dehydrogenase-like Zn-dependent dehydrogenase